MKFFKKSGILFLLLTVLCLALVAACAPEGETPGGETPGGETPGGETPGGETPEDETATLILSAGEGGSLETTEYEVKVGANVSQFLEGKAPSAEEGLTFAGWYEGRTELSATRTMPKSGLTLTAKYTASYTAHIYLENEEGGYPETYITREGSAFYGEAFTYTPSEPHFTLDSTKQNVLNSDKLGKNEVFTAYLSRTQVFVGFIANIPESADDGRTESISVRYGAAVEFPNGEELFSPSADYRFAGWAYSEAGEIAYAAGESGVPEIAGEADYVFFYARWETALHDVFDGEDRIFVSMTEERTVYLRRYGMEEKQGSFDANGLFRFEEEGKVALTGKLLDGVFYYFNDTLEREYSVYGGGEEKLTLGAQGSAVYVDDAGKAYVGGYDVDAATGDYVFTAEGIQFSFRLVEGLGGLLFRIRGEEAGSYALRTNESGVTYPVLTLDGFGYLTYRISDASVYGGRYLIDEAVGEDVWYGIIMDKYNLPVDYFDFRCTFESVSLAGYGGELSGTFRIADDFAGAYAVEDGSNSQALVLDGFGAGTWMGAQGTYTVAYASWYQLYYQEVYTVEHVFVTFTTNSGIVARGVLREGSLGTYFSVIPDGAMYGIYDIANAVSLDGLLYTDAFVFLYGDGQAEVWVPYGMFETGEGLYILMFDDGIFELDGDEVRVYTEDGSYDLSFTLEDGWLYAPSEGIEVGGGITFDGYGDAWYNGERIYYSAEPGIYYVYTFYIGEELHRYVYMNGEFCAAVSVLDEVYADPNRMGDFTVRILVLENGKALVGILMPESYYVYVIYGSLTPAGGTANEFIFRMEENNAGDAVLTLYETFRFRRGNDTCEIYDYTIEIAGVLTTDGYGRGFYRGQEGTYSIADSIIVFRTTDGTVFRLAVNAEEGTVTELGSEAGIYRLFEGGEFYYSEYLFFDGEGNVVVYMQEWYAPSQTYTDEYIRAEGTYEKISEFTVAGFTEYRITVPADTPYYGLEDGVFYVMVGRYDDGDGFEFGYFVCREPAQSGEFNVVGGGSLKSDGYNLDYATYTDAEGNVLIGILYICDLLDGSWDVRDFDPNAHGKHILFAVVENDEVVEYLAFDLTEEGAWLRTEQYGAFAKFEDGERTQTQLYLDGHGGAVIYDKNGNEVCRGTVAAYPEIDEDAMQFVEEGNPANTFVFHLYSVWQVGGDVYEYRVYTAEENGVYVSKTDWWVLLLDGYGVAMFIDRYGVVTRGDYIIVEGWLVVLYPDALDASPVYFSIKDDGSFELIEDDFVIAGDTLYAYRGRAATVTIPEGVKRIRARAFRDSKSTTVNLNEVEFVASEAFVGSRIVTVIAPNLMEISARAFYNCEDLTSIEMAKVQTIGEEAFFGCKRLRYVKLSAVTQIGSHAFTHIEMYQDTLTLDLLSCPDVTAISIAPDAFEGIEDGVLGGTIHIRILVKDIDTVNTVFAGTVWPEGVRPYASLEYPDIEATHFIDFATGNLYGLVDGWLSLAVAGWIDPTYGTAIGLYTELEGNTVIYFLKANGSGYNTAALPLSNILSAEGYTLFALATEHTLESNRAEGMFVFTLTARYAQNSTGYYFAFTAKATLGGTELTDIRYNTATRTFFTQCEGEFLQITVVSASACTAEPFGSQVVLTTSDEEFRLTLRLDDDGNVVELVKLEYKNTKGNWVERSIVSVEYREGSVLFVTAGSSSSPAYYTVTYTAEGPAVVVELYGETKNNVPVSGSGYATKATLVVKDGKIVEVKSFTYQDELMTIEDVVIDEDGAAIVTVTGGAKYKITFAPGRYSDYITVEVVE